MRDFRVIGEGENPFAGYGSIVSGPRFLGRLDGLRRIEGRVIRPGRPGNLAIVGDPRIGKSSLAYQAIMIRRNELETRGLLPIWMPLGRYEKVDSVFSDMMMLVARELRRLGRLNEVAETYCKKATTFSADGEARLSFFDFFKAVHELGTKTIFVLDEFDTVRELFRGNSPAFQCLRDLSYYPEYGVNYVTTSRRTIEDIEQYCDAGSTFYGTFQNYHLGMYDGSDQDAFFVRLSEAGSAINTDMRDHILAHAGAHPMLLDILGYWLVELEKDDASSARQFEAAADAAIDDYLGVFGHIVRLLREDRGLSHLLQIVHGPILDVRQSDIDQFLRRGLVVRCEDGSIHPFSSTFATFLGMLDRETQAGDDLWPIWRRTEKEMRQFVAFVMNHTHGEKWLEHTERAHPNVRTILERCRVSQAEEEKRFKGRASTSLLDFSYPADLFELIFAEWRVFQPLLGRDKNYWSERKALLSRIRNPLAHVRDEMLYEWERKTAEGYCQEVLAAIEKAREAASAPGAYEAGTPP
jgi:hypothetical protein